jgi:hypothetical protein
MNKQRTTGRPKTAVELWDERTAKIRASGPESGGKLTPSRTRMSETEQARSPHILAGQGQSSKVSRRLATRPVGPTSKTSFRRRIRLSGQTGP